MNDKFDKKLTDKFREEFENFSEPYNSENWSRLEKKLLSLKRNKVLKNTVGIAASFGLIYLGIVLYNINLNDYNITKISKYMPQDKMEPTKLSNTVSDSIATDKRDIRNSAITDVTLSKNKVFISKRDEVEKGLIDKKNILPMYQENKVVESVFKRRLDKREHTELRSNAHLLARNVYIEPTSRKKKKEIRLGFVFSPQVNHAENDYDSEICFAGGVSSELPLFLNFKLDVGLLISKQNIGIDSEIERTEGTETYGRAQSKKMDAQLLALDIPINLKYNLIENSGNSFFISAGISSRAYFSENYNSAYYAEDLLTLGEKPGRTNTVLQEEEKTVKAFKRFDTAKILNFSFGMDYRFRNGMGLQIEPFIKYPLGLLTSENIKLGSGGIQFRVYF